MSTTTTTTDAQSDAEQPHGSGSDSDSYSDSDSGSGSRLNSPKARRLAAYLREEAGDGEAYVKAKFIADDVGLSPKEIGALMLRLQERAAGLSIEKWSYTGATTWRVRPS
jgi:hypothetical protein